MTKDNPAKVRELVLAILAASADSHAEFAAAVPGGTLDPTTIPKYVTNLVIPGVMKKSANANPNPRELVGTQ